MKRKLLMLAAMTGMCVLGMMSCRSRAQFSAGKSLSPAETQALLASSQEKQTQADASDPEQKKEFYYVAGSGTVYHTRATCGYLKNAQNVHSGSLSQVTQAGKTKLCSACEKAQSEGLPALDEASEQASQEERICYYTAGGKVWHYDRGCATLANSENVLSGTETQAALDGKTRPCARCGD